MTDYTSYLKKDGLKGKRIGVIKNSGGFSDRVDTLMIQAIAFMKAQGAEVIEIEAPKDTEY